jgi:hypothetical protein
MSRKALSRAVAIFRAIRAGRQKGTAFQKSNYFTYGNLIGRLAQNMATPGPTEALNVIGTFEGPYDLFQVFYRNVLTLCYNSQFNGAFSIVLRHIEQ